MNAAAAITGLLSSASLCKEEQKLLACETFYGLILMIIITCNAPMPALPRVHIDGAAANALANACLCHTKPKRTH